MSQTDEELIREIKGNGWRQGRIFPREAMSDPALYCARCVEKNALMVVMSQSCDILNSSFEKEPVVDVINFFPVDIKNSAYEKGRNPRLYQLFLQGQWYEAKILNHYRVDRKICAKYTPDSCLVLGQKEVESVSHWLAARYVRPAFPDNFNRFVGKKWSNVRKILDTIDPQIQNQHSDIFSYILLRVSDDELPKYDIMICGTLEAADYQDKMKKELAADVIRRIAAEIDKCNEIDADGCCKSELQFSLHDLRSFRKLSIYDDLSFETGIQYVSH